MKKLPYRQTDTGIRISRRKNKWMAPVKAELPEYEGIVSISKNASLNLFIHNMNLFLPPKNQIQTTDIIDVTDLQEGDPNGM